MICHALVGHSLGLKEVYPAVAGAVLIGLLVWLRLMTGKWSGQAEPGSLAELSRWVLIVGVAIHVALLVYLAASTLLMPAASTTPDQAAKLTAQTMNPFLAMGFVIRLLIFSGPSWRWVLLAGVCLHLGILLTMEIGWFSQVTLCWYVLFVPGASLSAAVRATLSWLRGGPKAAVPATA